MRKYLQCDAFQQLTLKEKLLLVASANVLSGICAWRVVKNHQTIVESDSPSERDTAAAKLTLWTGAAYAIGQVMHIGGSRFLLDRR